MCHASSPMCDALVAVVRLTLARSTLHRCTLAVCGQSLNIYGTPPPTRMYLCFLSPFVFCHLCFCQLINRRLSHFDLDQSSQTAIGALVTRDRMAQIKNDHPFAWVAIVAGMLMAGCFAFMWLATLYPCGSLRHRRWLPSDWAAIFPTRAERSPAKPLQVAKAEPTRW